jgi:GNAT superfamily N-acetyltransferase
MQVRARAEEDLAACQRLAEIVHVNDGYPVYLPEDLRSFLAAPNALAAWVAVHGGEIVGHVALHAGSSGAVTALAQDMTGLPAARLGVVARLLVSPSVRRLGIGRSLLDVAAGHAVQLGLQPILDVVDRHEAAIRLYEKSGWTRAGKVKVTFGRRVHVDEFVFIGPGIPPP